MPDPIHRQHPDPAARTYRTDPIRRYPLSPPRPDTNPPPHPPTLSTDEQQRKAKKDYWKRKRKSARERAEAREAARLAYLNRDVLHGPYSQLDTDPYATEPYPPAPVRRFDPERDGPCGFHKQRVLLGAGYEPFHAQRVHDRDRNMCHICGEYIRPSGRSIDHVIPLTFGGDHSLHNIRAAHIICNQEKNADPDRIDIRGLLPPPAEFFDRHPHN